MRSMRRIIFYKHTIAYMLKALSSAKPDNSRQYFSLSRLKMPLLTLPFLLRVFFLGLIGVTMAQNLAFLGLSYSSPIVAIGMANLLPALSFLLALILRTTKFNWKSSGSQARLIGTFISIMGAASLTLYRGPTIKNHSSPALSLQSTAAPPRQHLFVFLSTHENWVLGCILFAASSLALSIWNVIQVGTVKIYPQVMKIVSFYSLFGTIQSAVLAAFIERDPTAWTLELNLELFVIILTAIFSSLIRSSVHMWCMRIKGPYFVPIFKPLGIPIASVFGCFLFADTFHYGSMMGAFVCGMGYYTVIWGQVREDDEFHNNRSSSDDKVPLLQEDSQV
ncbi:WAT1-related At1g70260-like [Olea europaea subsp. europaea]|uniref:WAT1-related At1g70260-like n=1 Tax=Olea europaea subsp. europaea TaxID=158383 RepID=A0A8S0PLU7_OLEEU|nr:WAT1-related At1g70260-like [Olea europaea subsp. europaea]